MGAKDKGAEKRGKKGQGADPWDFIEWSVPAWHPYSYWYAKRSHWIRMFFMASSVH